MRNWWADGLEIVKIRRLFGDKFVLSIRFFALAVLKDQPTISGKTKYHLPLIYYEHALTKHIFFDVCGCVRR